MNKQIIFGILAAMPLSIFAQTAIDAHTLSRYDLKGTARSMSMGGAFGALGGDLSAINVNPGGIGVYRKSEVGLTLDIDMFSSTTNGTPASFSANSTAVNVNNVGYVGTASLPSEVMSSLSWGFSYNRAASFDRRYHGAQNMNGSLTNYIAGYTSTEGWSSDALSGSEANYFGQYGAPWMSILAYNSYLINPQSYLSASYGGLWRDNATNGEYEFNVEEKGHIDEYEISLGGNISDVVYWGVGIGITDIEFRQTTYYEEYLGNALLPQYVPSSPLAPEHYVAGSNPSDVDVSYGLESRRRISGSGFNFKIGAIVRPAQWLRLGLAVHTPTYYNITESSYGTVDYYFGNDLSQPEPGFTQSPEDYRYWKLRTPWRLIASAAGIIGNKAIISADYEYRPYSSTVMKFADGYDISDYNSDTRNFYQASSILRLGGEYRLSSMFSVRAGYALETSPVTAKFKDRNPQYPVFTSNPDDTGVTPSYTIGNSTNYITCGVGFRYKKFYADMAYVHKRNSSEFVPYTTNNYTATPLTTHIKSTNNNIVLSVGLRF